jgi:sugar phosphate permease
LSPSLASSFLREVSAKGAAAAQENEKETKTKEEDSVSFVFIKYVLHKSHILVVSMSLFVIKILKTTIFIGTVFYSLNHTFTIVLLWPLYIF